MRFPVAAAFAIGVLLPALETLRRGVGEWTRDFTTMFEDYVAGALLLVAAIGATRERRWAPLFLIAAWGYVTGLMSSSFWYQLEETLRGTITEDPVVLAVKLLLWGTCVLALVASFRAALRGSAS
jgi:uncharacterized membrane protein